MLAVRHRKILGTAACVFWAGDNAVVQLFRNGSRPGEFIKTVRAWDRTTQEDYDLHQSFNDDAVHFVTAPSHGDGVFLLDNSFGTLYILDPDALRGTRHDLPVVPHTLAREKVYSIIGRNPQPGNAAVTGLTTFTVNGTEYDAGESVYCFAVHPDNTTIVVSTNNYLIFFDL